MDHEIPHRFGSVSGLPGRPLVLAGLLVLLTAITYVGTLSYEFVWDDNWLIVNNPLLREWSRLPALLVSDFWNGEPALERSYYRPLVSLSYFLEYRLWGLHPAGYHLTNVLLHLACTLLLFAVARRLFPDVLVAFVAALIFAVHPIHSESVAFISGRTDLLASVFSLLSVLLYLDGRGREGGRRVWSGTASVIAFALALLSKEVAAVLPLVLLLYELLPGRDRGSRIRLLARHLPFWAVLAGYLVLRTAVLGAPLARDLELQAAGERAFLGVRAMAGYLRLMVLPHPLSAQHMLAPTGLRDPALLLSLAAVAGALAALAFAVRRTPRHAFCGLWVFVTLLPVSNVIPIAGTSMAERFAYLPSAGFSMLAAAGIARALRWASLGRAPVRTAVFGGLGVVLVAGMSLTMLRNEDWKNEFRLFSRTAEDAPASPRARTNLGYVHLRRGELGAAIDQFERSLALDPDRPDTLIGLGVAYSVEGRHRDAQRYGERALALDPRNPTVQGNLASIYANAGEYARAVAHYRASLRQKPDNPLARYNLAVALAGLGRQDEAMRELASADALATRYLRDRRMSYRTRALVLERSDRERAIEAWTEYIAVLNALPDPTPFDLHELESARGRVARLRDRSGA